MSRAFSFRPRLEELGGRALPSGGLPGPDPGPVTDPPPPAAGGPYVWDYHGPGLGDGAAGVNWLGRVAPPATGAEVVFPAGTGGIDAHNLVGVSAITVDAGWGQAFVSPGLDAARAAVASGEFVYAGDLVVRGGALADVTLTSAAEPAGARLAGDTAVTGTVRVTGRLEFDSGTTTATDATFIGGGRATDYLRVDGGNLVVAGEVEVRRLDRVVVYSGDLQVAAGTSFVSAAPVSVKNFGVFYVGPAAVAEVTGEAIYAFSILTNNRAYGVAAADGGKVILQGGGATLAAPSGVILDAGTLAAWAAAGYGELNGFNLVQAPYVYALDASVYLAGTTTGFLNCTGVVTLRHTAVWLAADFGGRSDTWGAKAFVFSNVGPDASTLYVGYAGAPVAGKTWDIFFPTDADGVVGGFGWVTPNAEATTVNNRLRLRYTGG